MATNTNLPEHVDVAIVGAGLAGLAAARRVHESGRSVALLEAADGVGGRVRTDVVDGFRLDRGFQVLLTAYPELDKQVDLEALDLRAFAPGAMIWHDGRARLVGDPFRRPGTLPATLTAPVGSPLDKLRILRQRLRLQRTPSPQLLRQDDIATIDALAGEGFSTSMIERFFRPLVGGIQLDPTLKTSRRMFDVIFRSMIEGDVAVPAKGMGALSDQLASHLPPGTIHLDTRVDKVGPGEVITGTSTVRADRVVVATEGPAAAQLLGLPEVDSNAATCVWFAAETAPISDPYIILCPTDAGPVHNLAIMTNVAPEYAADGRALIAAACPGVADADAGTAARAQLRSMFGSDVETWTLLRTDVIPHGQPRQHVPFSPKQRVDLGEGLFVCGDHRDTASIQGALYSGRRCGDAVVASLV